MTLSLLDPKCEAQILCARPSGSESSLKMEISLFRPGDDRSGSEFEVILRLDCRPILWSQAVRGGCRRLREEVPADVRAGFRLPAVLFELVRLFSGGYGRHRGEGVPHRPLARDADRHSGRTAGRHRITATGGTTAVPGRSAGRNSRIWPPMSAGFTRSA